MSKIKQAKSTENDKVNLFIAYYLRKSGISLREV